MGRRIDYWKNEGLVYTTERLNGDYIYKIKGQKRLLKILLNS